MKRHHKIAMALWILLSMAPTMARGEDVLTDGFFVAQQPMDVPEVLTIKRAILRAQDNDNRQFLLWVALPWSDVEPPALALRVNGEVFAQSSFGASEGQERDYTFIVEGEARARAVASYLGVKAEARVHPGHRLITRFDVDHPKFVAGDPIEATLTIKNVGSAPVRFMDGGYQRGARNNQFLFSAFFNGAPLLDTGDPMNFGGIAGRVDLKPGETYTKKVKLSDWFKLNSPGHYDLFGGFILHLVDDGDELNVIWDDYATGQFFFTIEDRVDPSK